MSQVSWPELLSLVTAAEPLGFDRAQSAMMALMSGDTADDDIEAFLLGLNASLIAVEDFDGFLSGLLTQSLAVPTSKPVCDVVGTGGDGLDTVNVSTMAAIVVAACGLPVAKHGNRAASSRCGSADVIEALGVPLDLGPEQVAACINEVGIGFCFAPTFHPAMRHVGPVRRRLGVRTIFNFLGPLANPAGATSMLVGCSDPAATELLAQVLSRRGTAAAVVRADNGMDELSTSCANDVIYATRHLRLNPADFGIEPASAADLAGGDAAENSAAVRAVLSSSESRRVVAVRQCVALNAAGVLATATLGESELGADAGESWLAALTDGLERARTALAAGDAERLLNTWVEVARSQC